MDDKALKSLLETQEQERASLLREIEEDRQKRAWQRVQGKLGAPTLQPPGMGQAASPAWLMQVEMHNLRLAERQADEQKLAALQRDHLQKLAQERVTTPGKQFNGQAKDQARAPAPPGDPGELARQEENQRFRDESLRRFGFMQGRERGLGRGLRRDGAAGTDE